MTDAKWAIFRISVMSLLLTVLSAGCGGGPPPPVNPPQARDALRTILDAWKKGESYEAFKERNASFPVNEFEWGDGYKLSSYKIDSEKEMGASLQCEVQLNLEDAKGNAVQRNARYQVTTSPVVTVVRDVVH